MKIGDRVKLTDIGEIIVALVAKRGLSGGVVVETKYEMKRGDTGTLIKFDGYDGKHGHGTDGTLALMDIMFELDESAKEVVETFEFGDICYFKHWLFGDMLGVKSGTRLLVVDANHSDTIGDDRLLLKAECNFDKNSYGIGMLSLDRSWFTKTKQ